MAKRTQTQTPLIDQECFEPQDDASVVAPAAGPMTRAPTATDGKAS